MNSLWAVLEIFLSRVGPMPWIHIPFLVLLLAGYLGVAYITKATQGFYTYNFLDPKTDGSGMVAAYIVGIPIGICILFVIIAGIHWVKVWFFEKVVGIDQNQFVHGGSRKRMSGPGGFEPKA